jgi:signal transduction histidine kinase
LIIPIRTRYEDNDDRPIKVRFIDNGPGIHRLDWDRIFDPLFTTRPGGTGIGLFLCLSLANVIGAEVFVEKSLILVGTTFRVDIPLR